jgi:hypothetical protein
MGNSTTTIAWETLREEGLRHLRAMSGHLWTDYNLHDPGVTLLELLCYAITDLNERVSLGIANLVTENTATATTEHFFSPGSILTVNPVTINDYRKLLIDLPGVKNAWLEPITGSGPALYFDQDNNALLYDYASGARKLSLNGLYRVSIECEATVIDRTALKATVLQKLHDHRNLGEDFVAVRMMEDETIAVYSDIQIDENADAHEVMAQIYYDLKNLISPRVKQYSLKRLLQKGKSIAELFTGPPLENGFIDDDELGDGQKVKELHTSDLIRVIMANEAVKDIRNLSIANTLTPGIRDQQEWALVVDDTKALVLESFNSSKLRLFKNETLCPINAATVLQKVALLEAAAAREIYDDPALDLSEALPEIPDELSAYQTIADQLPANYGVGETGLPSAATEARRGQARQLRAYLSFFEQILVNYLKQLNSFKRLFAFRQDRGQLLKSYFSRLAPEELWQEDYPDYLQLVFTPPTNDRLSAIVASVVLKVIINAVNKQVAVDSFTIIAGVNAEFSAAIWNYLKDHGYLDAAGNVLPAFDPDADDFGFDLDLEAVRTKFAAEIGRILARYYSSDRCVPENAFADIGGVDAALSQAIWKYLYDLKYLESDGKVLFIDPTESLPFCATAFNRKNRILDHLLAQFNERFADYALFDYQYQPYVAIKATDKEEFYLKSKADFLEGYPKLSRNRNRADNYWSGATTDQSTNGLKNLIAAKLGIDLDITDSDAAEEFYIIEHILLRPRTTGRLDFICSEQIAASHQPDPYSYQLTFVLPKKAGRFSNSKFKELAYTTITNETPAHLAYTVLEFSPTEMSLFKECYQNYRLELTKWRQGTATEYHQYRKQLLELLGIGEPKLPVLHLDANNVNGDDPAFTHGTAVTQWIDLSGNSHHAWGQTAESAPQYWQPETTALPWLHFSEASRLQISKALFKDDFTIAVVLRTTVQTGREQTAFALVAGAGSTKARFELGFKGNGDLFGEVGAQTVTIESEAVSPHLAVFSYDSTANEVSLTLDGALELTQTVDSLTFDHQTVTLGAGVPCDVGEVIILDSVLSGTGKTKLEEYLAAKWSIPLSAVSSIAQPALHLDANVAASIAKTDLTNKVSGWRDVSLNESAVAQAATKLQPVYDLDGIGGLPALYFHNSALTLPNPQQRLFKGDFTLALVYRADAGGGYLLDASASESGQKGFAITLGNKGALTIQGQSESLKLAATLGTAHIAIVTGQVTTDGQAEVAVYLDGQASATRVFADAPMFGNVPLELTIGRSQSGASGFDGKIGEMVIFDATLTVWDRQRLENFWAEKWRIDISGVDSVAAPLLHLDASRQAAVLDGTGAAAPEGETTVYQWLDRGAEGNHAVQANAARRPWYVTDGINGLGAIKFTQEPKDQTDYYDDALNVDRIIQQDFTIMLVFKPDAVYYADRNIPTTFSRDTVWTEGVALLDADCSGHYNDFGISFAKTGSKLVVLGGIGDRVTIDHTIQSEPLDFAAPHFVTLTRHQADGLVKLYVDGRLHARADLRDAVNLNDSKTIKIGAFNSEEGVAFHGLIGEVLIFDRVLTDQKRQQIESYLATKWEIAVVTLPLDTTGLSLHLDAADANSITQDSEQRVSQWADSNPLNEIVALQPVAEYQPVYLASGSCGTPAIRFNNSCLTVAPALTAYDDLTLALVYTPFSTGNLDPGWEGGAGLVDHYAAAASNNFGVVINRNSTLGTRTGTQRLEAATTLNQPQIGVVTRSQAGKAGKIYLDGLLAASGDGAPEISLEGMDEWQIGAIRQLSGETVSKGYYHGELAEVLLFNRVLTPAERQSWEAYAAAKWRIDLSGINGIATPALHLDAGKLATIIEVENGKVSQWLDRDGRGTSAVQPDSGRRPEYRANVYQELGAIHFDRARQSCLTLEPAVTDDFAIFIVYQAEASDVAAYMPVAPDSFTVIAGVDAALSATLWTHCQEQGYLDTAGKVTAAFIPGAAGFGLGLPVTVLRTIHVAFASGIGAILAHYFSANTIVPEAVFTAIGGVDAKLSQSIWQYLYGCNYLNSDGRVLNPDFTTQTGAGFSAIIEAVVVKVILAQNWLEGVGLFDGNCAGEPGQPNKRDFGLLIGKDGQLLAGIGVPDEQDYQLAQPATFNQWHLGILTRVKATGVTRLYLDGATPVETKVAKNVSLKDSKQFTIGAENNGGNYFTGAVGELVVLDTVPDDTGLAAIQSYLAKKWGIGL